MSAAALQKQLNLPRHKVHLIWQALKQLENQGNVVRTERKIYRYQKKLEVCQGIFKRKFSGAGDVITDNAYSPIRLQKREARYLVDGDRVQVRLTTRRNGIWSGRFDRIVHRRSEAILCYYRYNGHSEFADPVDPRVSEPIRVDKGRFSKISNRHVVMVSLHGKPSRRSPLSGTIVELIGKRHEFGVETALLIQKFKLRDDHPGATIDEARNIIETITPLPDPIREDLRKTLTITVDPDNARDFDDALSLEKRNNGYRLGVHIADVSHYIDRNSEIDREALCRGTSVYLPERAIHMLPENLATNLCSLKQNEDRLTMTAWIDLDKEGKIHTGRCVPSIICSDARLTYRQFLEAAGKSPPENMSEPLKDLCKNLQELCRLLLNQRAQRGVLDLDIPETEFELDGNGKVCGIHKKKRGIAEQSIEEFMLAANIMVAEMLDKADVSYLRRVHEPPDITSVQGLKNSLSDLGLTPPENPLDPEQVRPFLSAIENPAIRSVASYYILRSMRRAVYSPTGQGHFGLALTSYTQFTSPIRRYPDLEVHRAIKAYLHLPGYSTLPLPRLEKMAKDLSDRERAAQEAEWDAIKRKKIQFMQDKVGEVFTGTITNVEEFGAFVEVDEPFVEGLIPCRLLDGYFIFDPLKKTLFNASTQQLLKAGGSVSVRVEVADQDRSILDFLLADILKD